MASSSLTPTRRSGRLVVGVLNRGVEGQVRGRLRALGVDSQSVDVVETEPIIALATLRDRSDDIVGGLQIRFSQYLCSLGFPAFRNGVRGFVTASHCSDNQGAVDGTTYYQPLDQVAERSHRDRDRRPALRARRQQLPERKEVPSVRRELQPLGTARGA